MFEFKIESLYFPELLILISYFWFLINVCLHSE